MRYDNSSPGIRPDELTGVACIVQTRFYRQIVKCDLDLWSKFNRFLPLIINNCHDKFESHQTKMKPISCLNERVWRAHGQMDANIHPLTQQLTNGRIKYMSPPTLWPEDNYRDQTTYRHKLKCLWVGIQNDRNRRSYPRCWYRSGNTLYHCYIHSCLQIDKVSVNHSYPE